MKSRSVSVTGATGFVGWHVATAFRSAGWRVRAVVRPGTSKPLPPGVERVEAALDAPRLIEAVGETDLVVHAAGVTRAGRASAFAAVNVAGTRAVVDAANAAGARLILISSQAAIGPGTIRNPSRESDPPRPLTPYGRSKLEAELAVRAGARGSWTIVRPSSVYGPRDQQFLALFRLAARGLFFRAARPDTPFTFIYVDDLARGIVLAGDHERAAGETLFFGHPEPSTADELLQRLAVLFGRTYRPLEVPALLLRGLAWGGELSWMLGREPMLDVARLTELSADGFVCAIDRAREVLGFTAEVPLSDGLERTARWYRDQGWI